MKKKILVLLLIVFIGIQFIRPSVKANETGIEFHKAYDVPEDVSKLIKSACYDCHSVEVDHPWYSQIAPVSWWIQDHINHGRKHLNFSNWPVNDPERAEHKLEECIEEIKEDKMPLKSYRFLHNDGNLSEEEKKLLTDFFEKSMNN